MTYLIDRRLNAKNKSSVNRQRFLRRYKNHIKRAVSDAIGQRSITDMDKGEQITIPNQDIQEPVFGHGPGGKRTIIHPGNKDFIKGDSLPRRQSGGGGAGGKAGNSGEGMDDFAFHITQEEFLEFMFEDLELPNLIKRQLAGTESFKLKRAGFSTVGTPNQINIVRSLKSANARRIALGTPSKKKIKQLEQELQLLLNNTAENKPSNKTAITVLREEIEALKKKLKRIPFIDTFDIKYNLSVKHPQPSAKAVMFCIMDVSGSMSQGTKDIAKRFFILLYLFLQRNYDHTEVIFIRHHTAAKEVDEQEFFYSRETGGTIVSSALEMMKSIISDRYPSSEWNIYGAQASDGDNWNDDSDNCFKLLSKDILPLVQHFSYVEINPQQHQDLWHSYQRVQALFPKAFAMQQIIDPADIYPVFRELFHRRSA
ncbi:MAG: YeaH/YhbH family protein [Spongiibacteraceae bacterium]